MTSNLSRAHFLFEQRRYDMAVEELGRQIAEDPDDPFAHCLLALCFSQLKRNDDALREARSAVQAAPDLAYGQYVLGHVLERANKHKEAEAAAREAVRLDPEEADHYALLASIRYQQSQWAEALHFAELGIALEPDKLTCANLRGMALVQMGRKDEAGAAIQGTLEKDPENAATHANQGWALLHRGDHTAALVHFREALRLNPEMEWARQGILEALRARNPIYRVMLNYFLWTSRLGTKARYAFVIGIYILPRLFRALTQNNPTLRPVSEVVFGLYLAFAFLTWTAKPLFNVLLRMDPVGRYALSRQQILASNWVGSSFLLATLGFVAWAVTRSEDAAFIAGGYAFLTAIIAATFAGSTTGTRRLIGSLTALAGVLFSGFVVALAFGAAPLLGLAAAALILGLLAFNITAQATAARHALR